MEVELKKLSRRISPEEEERLTARKSQFEYQKKFFENLDKHKSHTSRKKRNQERERLMKSQMVEMGIEESDVSPAKDRITAAIEEIEDSRRQRNAQRQALIDQQTEKLSTYNMGGLVEKIRILEDSSKSRLKRLIELRSPKTAISREELLDAYKGYSGFCEKRQINTVKDVDRTRSCSFDELDNTSQENEAHIKLQNEMIEIIMRFKNREDFRANFCRRHGIPPLVSQFLVKRSENGTIVFALREGEEKSDKKGGLEQLSKNDIATTVMDDYSQQREFPANLNFTACPCSDGSVIFVAFEDEETDAIVEKLHKNGEPAKIEEPRRPMIEGFIDSYSGGSSECLYYGHLVADVIDDFCRSKGQPAGTTMIKTTRGRDDDCNLRYLAICKDEETEHNVDWENENNPGVERTIQQGLSTPCDLTPSEMERLAVGRPKENTDLSPREKCKWLESQILLAEEELANLRQERNAKSPVVGVPIESVVEKPTAINPIEAIEQRKLNRKNQIESQNEKIETALVNLPRGNPDDHDEGIKAWEAIAREAHDEVTEDDPHDTNIPDADEELCGVVDDDYEHSYVLPKILSGNSYPEIPIDGPSIHSGKKRKRGNKIANFLNDMGILQVKEKEKDFRDFVSSLFEPSGEIFEQLGNFPLALSNLASKMGYSTASGEFDELSKIIRHRKDYGVIVDLISVVDERDCPLGMSLLIMCLKSENMIDNVLEKLARLFNLDEFKPSMKYPKGTAICLSVLSRKNMKFSDSFKYAQMIDDCNNYFVYSYFADLFTAENYANHERMYLVKYYTLAGKYQKAKSELENWYSNDLTEDDLTNRDLIRLFANIDINKIYPFRDLIALVADIDINKIHPCRNASIKLKGLWLAMREICGY